MLARTTNPKPDESLLGFLRRLSTFNAFIDTGDFFSELGIRYGRPLIESIADLERKCGLPAGELAAIAPEAKPNDACREWQYDRRYSDPVCPMCIADGKVYHQSWRHTLVTACPEHKCRLEDTCPRCSEPLTPENGGHGKCSCGTDLSRLPVQTAPRHEVLISQLISGIPSSEVSGLPKQLVSSPPADIGRFVHFLASSFSTNRTGKALKTKLPRTVEEAVVLLEPVASLLENWPNGFEDHVRERLVNADPALNSAPARLGNWYQRFMQFKDPAYEPFHKALGGVVSKEFSGTYLGSLQVDESREWVSAKEAAQEIGITSQRLVEAVQKKQIAGKQSRSGYGHTHTVIPRLEVHNILADRERYCDGTTIRNLLGVSRKQLELLREAAVVSEIALEDRPPLIDGGFDRIALADRLARISASAVQRDGETISFVDLNLRRTTDRSVLIQIFQRIFDCEIVPVNANSEVLLGKFQYLKSDVERELSKGRFSKDWTAQDVARITGWKPQSVVHWCKLGLLEAREVSHGPNKGYLISPEQLAQFQSTFVPVAVLAGSRRTTSRRLLGLLAKSQIETYGAQKEAQTSRGHLVRLSDLMTLANSGGLPSLDAESCTASLRSHEAKMARSRVHPN